MKRGKLWIPLMGMLVGMLGAPGARAADAGLKPGDAVAICGDSITEQKKYSVFMEDYLLMCKPVANLKVTQFGWSGETAGGFSNKMENDLFWFKPTVATTCYGMNDGGYSPMNPGKGQSYHDNLTRIVTTMKAHGVRFIVVGSSGAVDPNTFRKDPAQAEMYNKTLGALHDIAQTVAKEQGVTFADVYTPMLEVMTKAEAKYGSTYNVAGGDGVHPNNNGHLVMAYAFLKALGCDGNIGTITLDLRRNRAQATDGHKILSVQKGTVQVESTRYPFCFFGNDVASTSSTRGMLEFLPFNETLNRFRLVVKGGRAKQYKVTWGASSKVFSAADLAKGINLAAEFLDNPFSDAFSKVNDAVQQQQNLETPLVKDWIHNHKDAEAEAGKKQDADLFAAAAAAVTPVQHTITVEPATEAASR